MPRAGSEGVPKVHDKKMSLMANTSGGRNCISGRIISAQKISLDFRPKFRPVFQRTEFEDEMVRGRICF